jgi:glycosyltransferase involved in cell wall biosynthesis
MIEAMACGTPVLAFRCGSVPEIIDENVTGCIVDTIEEAITALPRVIALDRKNVRQRFERRFSATRMAKDYVAVYRSLLDSSKSIGDEAPDDKYGLENGKDAITQMRPSIA